MIVDSILSTYSPLKLSADLCLTFVNQTGEMFEGSIISLFGFRGEETAGELARLEMILDTITTGAAATTGGI